jgi:prophage DNA circulation protein
MDILTLYQGLLLDASFGGRSFYMIDSRDQGGRRLLRFLFPGIDRAVYQDLGQDDGEIRIAGVMIGDDYQNQADLMRTAFQTQGPSTLVHPWLGVLLVELQGRPEISFTQDEFRVARFEATFVRFFPRPSPPPDTLQQIIDAFTNLQAMARSLLAQVLSPVVATLVAIGYVESFVSNVKGIWLGLAADAADPLVALDLAGPLAALDGIAGLPHDDNYPGAVCDALAAVTAAASAASIPSPPAVVAPGGSTTVPAAVDGRITTGMLLSGIAAIAATSAGPSIAPVVAVVAQSLALADAINCGSDIDFDSQQEAASWYGQLTAAVGVAATQAAALSATMPAFAGPVWRALIDTQSALAADLNAAVGRLPAVETLQLPQAVPVWLVAQYLAGDTPSRVLSTYLDLVQRNGIVHPGSGAGGALEVLQ